MNEEKKRKARSDWPGGLKSLEAVILSLARAECWRLLFREERVCVFFV